MNKISIDEPCSENWAQMPEQEKGRFCDKCCKVVIDFTSKTTDEIFEFLRSAGQKKICGRVPTETLSPIPVFNRPVKRSRLFLYALLLAFGGLLFTSCKSRKPPVHTHGGLRYDYFMAPQTHTDEVFQKK